MEKSLYWIKFSRKGAVIFASILLFVGIVLDVLFRFLGISSLIGFQIFGAGMILFIVTFALTITINFLLDKIKENKAKEANEQAEKQETKKIGFWEFLAKHENTIRLFFYTLAFCLTIYFCYVVFAKGNYWDIYYFICLFFWLLLLAGFVELFFSKDKKTFITQAVLLVVNLGLLIAVTVFAHDLYFNPASTTNLKTLDFLYLANIFILAVIYLISYSDNQIAKVKHTRNFGAGLILLCAGICMYFIQPIAEFIFNKWDTNLDFSTQVQNLVVPMNICMYVVLGLILASMLNVAFNTTHYIKTKNWLGIIDVLASFVCVILCIVGILAFANYIALLK